MPADIPVRANFQSGALSGSLASTATVVTFPAAGYPRIPTLAANQYTPLTLVDTAAVSNSEIVYMTGYTSGNSTAAVLRGQEGASARTWTSNATWEHAPTARDLFPQLTAGGNTAGTMTQMTSGLAMIAGGANITVQQSSNTLSILGAASGPAQATKTIWRPYDEAVGILSAISGGTIMFAGPHPMPNLSFDRVAFPMYWTNASNSTASVTVSVRFGIYTRNASTLSLLSSISTTLGMTNAGTASASSFHGIRMLTMGFVSNSWAESIIYPAVWFSSTTSSQNGSLSMMVQSRLNSNFLGVFGAASNASNQFVNGLGIYSVSSAALPASINFNELRGTGSILLRSPMFIMMSSTI